MSLSNDLLRRLQCDQSEQETTQALSELGKVASQVSKLEKFQALETCLREQYLFSAFLLVDETFLNFDETDANGNTPFFYIASTQKCASLLIQTLGRYEENGGDRAALLAHRNQRGESLLHRAALAKDRPMIRYLIGQGLSLFEKQHRGDTPFSLIADCFDLMKDIVFLCLQRNIVLEWDKDLISYLSLTTEQREELQKLGATEEQFLDRFSLCTNQDKLAYFRDTWFNYKFDLAEKMYSYLPFPHRVEDSVGVIDSESGQTPLHLACEAQNIRAIQFLIDKGANCNEIDHRWKSPFSILIQNTYLDGLKVMYQGASRRLSYLHTEQLTQKQEEQVNTILPLKQVIALKMASHLWGLSGKFVFRNIEFNAERSYVHHAISFFKAQVARFLLTQKVHQAFFSLGEVVMADGRFLKKTKQDLANAIVSKKWVLLPLNEKGHVTYFLIRYPMAYMCDRDLLFKEGGVVEYHIGLDEAEKLTRIEAVLDKIQAFNNQPTARDYFHSQMGADLQMVSTGLFLRCKPQKVSNCTIAGLKAAFKAILYRKALEEGLEHPIKLALDTYKRFSTWARKQVIDWDFIPTEMLQAIRQKVAQTHRFEPVEKEAFLKQMDERLEH